MAVDLKYLTTEERDYVAAASAMTNKSDMKAFISAVRKAFPAHDVKRLRKNMVVESIDGRLFAFSAGNKKFYPLEVKNPTSAHAIERVRDRIAQAGINPDNLLKIADNMAAKTTRDTAMLMLTLPTHYGSAAHDYYQRADSNGNQVWAIVRDKEVVTFMFRRADQPHTPEALRVRDVMQIVRAS